MYHLTTFKSPNFHRTLVSVFNSPKLGLTIKAFLLESIARKAMNKLYFDNNLRILSVFLVAVFIFSIPFMTASVEAKDAKSDAEKDTKNIKELGWFTVSCLGSALPFIGALVLNIADDSGNQHDITSCLQDDHLYPICVSVYGLGALLPTVYAILHSPIPPAERLLGKSPDYVSAYTDTYRNDAKRRRVVLSAAGCIAGTSIGIGILLMFAPDGSHQTGMSMKTDSQ